MKPAVDDKLLDIHAPSTKNDARAGSKLSNRRKSSEKSQSEVKTSKEMVLKSTGELGFRQSKDGDFDIGDPECSDTPLKGRHRDSQAMLDEDASQR
ncbi:hypothetical protein TNCV_1308781 [Trichonephila clavipes]|nr:hypothetical protein TNCV_1308781 [Trichonephila clavipes]